MRIRPTVYAKKAFPWDWHTTSDLVAPLSVQSKIAGDLEVYFLKTIVSYKMKGRGSRPKKPIRTKTGIMDPSESSSTSVPFISYTNPGQRVYAQREIFEDMVSSGASADLEVPDAVIKERCSVVKKPRELEDIKPFEEWDRILVHELSCSQFPVWAGKHFNIHTKSIGKIARDDLVLYGGYRRKDVPIRRMRSVLQLRSIIGFDEKRSPSTVGWGELYDPKTKTNESESLADALSRGKFHIDTAIPKSFKVINGVWDLRLYRLKEHSRYISLRLGPEWSGLI